MTIELTAALAVAIVSLCFNFYQYQKKTHSRDGSTVATVTSKLDHIAGDVSEIKSEIKSIRADWMRDHETLIVIERDMKTVWKRIDEISKSM